MKSLNLEKILSHGLELSKSIHFSPANNPLLITGLSDGPQEVIQDLKVLTIAHQELPHALEELLVTHIIEHAFTLDFELLELMVK